VVWKSFDMISW